MMQASFRIVIAFMLLAAPAAADDTDKPRSISISATGYVTATPDTARLSIGVLTEEASAAKSLEANSNRFKDVLAEIKRLGIKSEDIATEQFQVRPVYASIKSSSNNRQEIVAFRVVNSASVTVRDIELLGRLIDSATRKGANQIGNIAFVVSGMEQKLDAARADAMRNAIRRAKLYAEAAGAELGKVHTISEQLQGGGSPQPVYARAARMAAAPIEPGQQKLGVTVTGVWLLE